MTSTTDYLKATSEALTEFQARMADLKELEQSEQEWRRDIAISKQAERTILAERGSDADDAAERLHKQECKTRVLESRAHDIEKIAAEAYMIGSECLHAWSGAACYGLRDLKDHASAMGIDPSTVIDVDALGIGYGINSNVMLPAEFAMRRRRALATLETELPQRLSRLTGMLARMESEKKTKKA